MTVSLAPSTKTFNCPGAGPVVRLAVAAQGLMPQLRTREIRNSTRESMTTGGKDIGNRDEFLSVLKEVEDAKTSSEQFPATPSTSAEISVRRTAKRQLRVSRRETSGLQQGL